MPTAITIKSSEHLAADFDCPEKFLHMKIQSYNYWTNFGTTVLKKLVPAPIYQRVREALLFRPEDPNNLHQMPPQRKVANNGVTRIQGFRYPSPGSQGQVSIPLRNSVDDVYDITHYTMDHRNAQAKTVVSLGTSRGDVDVDLTEPHPVTHGKRKISLLDYDARGLRTTKTTTWEAAEAALAQRAKPSHLPLPEWLAEIQAVDAEREQRGLPPAVGRRQRMAGSGNFNHVRW
eukprot:gene27031-32664_t